jgi:hypothetical protein
LFWSFCLPCSALPVQLALLRPGSKEFNGLEILVWRHELAVLRARYGVLSSPRLIERSWLRRVDAGRIITHLGRSKSHPL